MEKIKKKDVIKVTVTGVQKYGAFVNTKDEDYDGLIHISETRWVYAMESQFRPSDFFTDRRTH